MVYGDNYNLHHYSWLLRFAKNCTRLSFSRTTQFYNFVHLFLRRGSNVDGTREFNCSVRRYESGRSRVKLEGQKC